MTYFDEGMCQLHRLHLLFEQSKELDMGALGPGDPMGVVAYRLRDLARDIERQIAVKRYEKGADNA